MKPSHVDLRAISPSHAGMHVRWLTLSLVLLLVALVYFLYDRYRQAEATAVAQTRNLVQVLESRLAGDFARVDGVLAYIASQVRAADLQVSPPAAAQEAHRQRLVDLQASFPMAGVLSIFDAQGTLRYTSTPNQKSISIADRPHFRRMRDDPKVIVTFSDAQIARTTGQWSIILVRALRDEQGRFLGSVNAVIGLDGIARLFGSVDVGDGGSILLRRSDTFRLIQRFPLHDEKDLNQPVPHDHAIRQRMDAGERAGTLKFMASTDGVERLVSFKVLDNYPFYVQVGFARSDYLAAWWEDVVAVAGLMVLLLLGFALILRRLRKDARKIAVATQQLAYRQALFSSLFEQAGFLAGILDAFARLLEVNQAALAVIGQSRDAVIGQNFPDLPWWSHARDRAALYTALRAAALGASASFEAQHPKVDGGNMTVLFNALPVLVGEERYIAVTGIDISARKAAENALRHSEFRLKEAQRIAMIGSWELDLVSNRLTWSDEIFRIFEIDPLQFEASYETFLSAIHPDDRDMVNAAYQSSLQDRLPYSVEHRLLFADGRIKHVREQCETTFSDGGKPLRSVGTVQDITARKQAEQVLQQNTRALERSNAELEQFAYVASHDLRQPLRMVNGYVQMLERRLAEKLDAETREMMHFVTDGAKRMDQMLVSLLDYSRVGRKGEPLALMHSLDAVNEALHFLEPTTHEAQATVRVSGDWPHVMVSRDEFTRLWQNLIGNAIKYRAENRAPHIDVSVTSGDRGWRFCVADNGIGIDPAQFGRLFKVFQRLHARGQYEGYGIGLAVARKIVERHGGNIWVESDGAGQGCRFCFTLPQKPDEA